MGLVRVGMHDNQIRNLKEEFVLTILNSQEINIEQFKNSELYLSHEKDFLIDHLYDVFHEINNQENPSNNKQIVASSKIIINFHNNTLDVIVNEVSYQYNLFNDLIHINGEHRFPTCFIATVNAPAVSLEKQLAAQEQFQKELKSSRLRRKDALAKSWEFAKTFKVR